MATVSYKQYIYIIGGWAESYQQQNDIIYLDVKTLRLHYIANFFYIIILHVHNV